MNLNAIFKMHFDKLSSISRGTLFTSLYQGMGFHFPPRPLVKRAVVNIWEFSFIFIIFSHLTDWPSESRATLCLVKALTRQQLGSTIFGSKELLGDDL